jgi:hypothetical protein
MLCMRRRPHRKLRVGCSSPKRRLSLLRWTCILTLCAYDRKWENSCPMLTTSWSAGADYLRVPSGMLRLLRNCNHSAVLTYKLRKLNLPFKTESFSCWKQCQPEDRRRYICRCQYDESNSVALIGCCENCRGYGSLGNTDCELLLLFSNHSITDLVTDRNEKPSFV